MLFKLVALLALSACGIENNQHSTLPDCDALPSHVEVGTGTMPVAGHSEPGKVYGAPPRQADLDRLEQELDHTHLPAGPQCQAKRVDGPPSAVPPTTPR
jgi:hypothetical protein